MTGGNTLAERFASALSAEHTSDLADAELLPVRLARAAVRMLPVDGAGLSIHDGAERRVPLGASDGAADRAERLQFTLGAGPCMQAQASGQPVFVIEEDLRRRWPAFHDLLVQLTPYRAVVALPLRHDLAGMGAMDFYFRDPAHVAGLDVFTAMATGDLVVQSLSEATVWSDWSVAEGPKWLRSPASVRRAVVWQAIGLISLAWGVPAEEALALLRGQAYAAGRSVDDLAADLVSGRADPTRGPAD